MTGDQPSVCGTPSIRPPARRGVDTSKSSRPSMHRNTGRLRDAAFANARDWSYVTQGWSTHGCLSSRRTFAPRSRRVWAAERPARPPPTTITWAICADRRMGRSGEEGKDETRATRRPRPFYVCPARSAEHTGAGACEFRVRRRRPIQIARIRNHAPCKVPCLVPHSSLQFPRMRKHLRRSTAHVYPTTSR